MGKPNIAIVGLGRVGSKFLEEIAGDAGRGVNLVAAAELAETAGKSRARASGIRLVDIAEIVSEGEKIDVIFDLTGNPDTRRDLRERLAAADNRHTVIAPETIARVLWAFISREDLPEIAGRKTGY